MRKPDPTALSEYVRVSQAAERAIPLIWYDTDDDEASALAAKLLGSDHRLRVSSTLFGARRGDFPDDPKDIIHLIVVDEKAIAFLSSDGRLTDGASNALPPDLRERITSTGIMLITVASSYAEAFGLSTDRVIAPDVIRLVEELVRDDLRKGHLD